MSSLSHLVSLKKPVRKKWPCEIMGREAFEKRDYSLSPRVWVILPTTFGKSFYLSGVLFGEAIWM